MKPKIDLHDGIFLVVFVAFAMALVKALTGWPSW